jgi:hypothetical protein
MDRIVEARKDVEAAVAVWGELIPERLGDRISYAALKGSVLKSWDGLVDYVPVISDLDIHIGTVNYQPLFPRDREGFKYALETTKYYEERFVALRPGHIHIPRPQFVLIEPQFEIMLPETMDEVIVLYGKVPLRDMESERDCQRRDLESLRNLKPLLDRLPERILDRIGLEYYRIIRELCWNVSPMPVRVLSQFTDSKKAWKMNRTQVLSELEEVGLSDLALVYRSYYIKGWEAFETGFTFNLVMRELISLAYDVLWQSYELAKSL